MRFLGAVVQAHSHVMSAEDVAQRVAYGNSPDRLILGVFLAEIARNGISPSVGDYIVTR